MSKTIVATEGYTINGFRHFSSIAWAYFPIYQSASAAVKHMRAQIRANAMLSIELGAIGYTYQTKELSPEMQLSLYRYWGPPKILLPLSVETNWSNSNAQDEKTEN